MIVVLLWSNIVLVNLVTQTYAAAVNTEENPCSKAQPGSFISNPYACEEFFYCDQHGVAIGVFCPDGMWFNSEKGICDIAENMTCIPKPQPTPPPVEHIECPEKDAKSVVFIASKINCQHYYLCYHGVPIKQECIPELHWNEKMNKCDFPENSYCTANPQLPSCPLQGEKLMPHPDECRYFIYCINGQLTVQQCPFYHFYDVISKSCKWRNVAKCLLQEEPNNRKRWLY